MAAVTRHQANQARIHTLRTEAEALQEQLKTSVSTLASLRHELFETPATSFAQDARPVHFDELLQYAKSISQYTVPPTYRERLPPPLADKDQEKEDAASGGAPTNGLNTPANVPDAMDMSKGTPEDPKESDVAGNGPPEITAEEEEWMKKLTDSKIAWYPWPSDDKIRTGNLYKLMYWQAKNKDMDNFDIYAYEEAERAQSTFNGDASEEAPKEAQLEVQAQAQLAAPRTAHIPQQNKENTFDAFDDLED
jgi:hypothetical protein